jgi:elongation factor Ts
VRELAMQVAGFRPTYPTIASIPAEVVEARKAALLGDEATQKKPVEIREKIVEGQLAKWYKEVVLYEQTFRDTEQTVGALITDAIARIGENIKVRRFVRFELGEAL